MDGLIDLIIDDPQARSTWVRELLSLFNTFPTTPVLSLGAAPVLVAVLVKVWVYPLRRRVGHLRTGSLLVVRCSDPAATEAAALPAARYPRKVKKKKPKSLIFNPQGSASRLTQGFDSHEHHQHPRPN